MQGDIVITKLWEWAITGEEDSGSKLAPGNYAVINPMGIERIPQVDDEEPIVCLEQMAQIVRKVLDECKKSGEIPDPTGTSIQMN